MLTNLKNSYAFVQYEKRQDATLAMKNLNNTNLLGANENFRARIEFSYKNKIGDKLEPSIKTPNTLEGQSQQNKDLVYNSYQGIDSFQNFNSSSANEIEIAEKVSMSSNSKEINTPPSIVAEKNEHAGKSSGKMEIDDYDANNESKTFKAYEDKNTNNYIDCIKENKNYDSYSDKENKNKREYERNSNFIKL